MLIVDAVVIVVFVVLGRRTHDLDGVADVLTAALPFWVGVLVAHLVVDRGVLGSRGTETVAAGPVIGGCTVVVGMALRRLAGGGTAVPFVIVATTFLVAVCTGWRAAASLRRRRIPQV